MNTIRQRGISYLNSGDTGLARTEFRNAVRLDPQFHYARVYFFCVATAPDKTALPAWWKPVAPRLRPDIGPASLRWTSWHLAVKFCGSDGPRNQVRFRYAVGSFDRCETRETPRYRIAFTRRKGGVWADSFRDTTQPIRAGHFRPRLRGLQSLRLFAAAGRKRAVPGARRWEGEARDARPAITETLQPICVDVAGAKEVVLRVLNGGDGNSYDSAAWGFARFVRAGAEDPLEEPPAELRSATDANAAFFLAEVHWRLDQKELARRWYDKAVAWMDKNKTEAEKLRGYRDEAAKLLGIGEKPSTEKEQPRRPDRIDGEHRQEGRKGCRIVALQAAGINKRPVSPRDQQNTHRPGISRAVGLRPGAMTFSSIPQAGYEKETKPCGSRHCCVGPRPLRWPVVPQVTDAGKLAKRGPLAAQPSNASKSGRCSPAAWC